MDEKTREAKKNQREAEEAHMRSTNANRTLLLGGRTDGYICVFNKDTGKVDFEIEVLTAVTLKQYVCEIYSHRSC